MGFMVVVWCRLAWTQSGLRFAAGRFVVCSRLFASVQDGRVVLGWGFLAVY